MSAPEIAREASREDYGYLPELLAEIAEVAGLDAALKIAQARGGARVHFPARARDDHWLVAVAGREAATKLCNHFRTTSRGGIELLVPLGPKNFYSQARRKFVRLMEGGCSVEQAARDLGVHLRSARRYRARMRDRDGAQGKLL